MDINDSANYFILAKRTASISGTVQTVRVKAGVSGNAKLLFMKMIQVSLVDYYKQTISVNLFVLDGIPCA